MEDVSPPITIRPKQLAQQAIWKAITPAMEIRKTIANDPAKLEIRFPAVLEPCPEADFVKSDHVRTSANAEMITKGIPIPG
jgi:hypothetical protein